MKAVLDTNVLISAILAQNSRPGFLLEAWHRRRFELVSSDELVEEIKRVSRYPRLAARLPRAKVGRLVNELRDVSEQARDLPKLDIANDPFDNYLLAMSQVSAANYLVTGDKADLLSLSSHGQTRIITVRKFTEVLGGC